MSVVVGGFSTPESREAFVVGLREARERGTDVVVVTRDPDLDPSGLLDAARGAGVDAGVSVRVSGLLDGEDLAGSIVEVASQEQADLVVVGLRRRSPVGKLVLGSGVQRILLEAPCPVLAVKPAVPASSGTRARGADEAGTRADEGQEAR